MRSWIAWALVLVLGSWLPAHAAAPKASLYERIGGEKALRAVIDDFYGRLQLDSEMKERFVGVDMTALKNQVFDFVGHAIGGPQRYHGKDMREAHAGMKISGEEWDRTVRYLKMSLNKCHVKAREKKELLDVVGSLRSQIVYEPAAAQAPPPADATLYVRLGGEPALRAVLSDLYDRLLIDPITKDRFVGVDIDHLKNQVVDFVGQAIGGPQVYQGKDMVAAHARFKITQPEWDATVRHLNEAMDKYHVGDRERDDLLKVVSSLHDQIVHP